MVFRQPNLGTVIQLREKKRPGITFVGLLVDRRGDTGVSSGEIRLEGIFEGKEIRDRKVTTDLVWRSKPEGVRGWKSSSGSEKTEKQS